MPEWSKEIHAALAGLNLNPAQEASVAEELAQHLEDRYEELRRQGLDDPEVSRLLRDELNNGQLVTEMKGLVSPSPAALSPGQDRHEKPLAGLGNDLRYTLRMLRLNPGFAAVAILSLALGIGANTAIFELLGAVLLRTLPVQSPQRLANIREIHGGRVGSTVARQRNFSFTLWQQIRLQQKAFSGIAAWSTETFDLGQGGEAHDVQGMWVSGRFFDTLGIQPFLGRLLTESDDYRGCGIRGVVISYAFWQRAFGGRADAVGSKLSLDGHPFDVIGVTPASFYGLEIGRNFDVAVPLCSETAIRTEGSWTESATTWWLDVIGRLNSGWTLGKANAQLGSIAPGIFTLTLPPEYDATERRDYLRFGLKAEPAATGVSELRAAYADPLRALLAISGLVLLLACTTNPIGRTFGTRQDEGKPDRLYQIVGLAGDTRYRDIHAEPTPIVFVSLYQAADAGTDSTFVVRSSEAPASLILSLKEAAAKSSLEIVLTFSILRTSILEKLTRERLMATLSGVYGALAAILAIVGIYGIISYMVIRRSSEMGLRIALGAQRRSVVGIVLREATVLVAGGLVVGTVVAIACARMVQTLLYGIKPVDPISLMVAAGGLLTIALISSLLPAVRAASVNPIEALREE